MRTFIAVELPENIKNKLGEVQASLKKLNLNVGWVKNTNIHATLKFLGEVPEDKLDKIYSGVELACQGEKIFGMNLKGLGGFPNVKNPRVIWVGVDKGKENLAVIQRRIEEELFKKDFPREERGFSPHLTLGRVKSFQNMERLAEQIKKINFETTEFPVKEVVVMKSQLHPAGAIYTPMRKILLI
jgi:2'-5' RNA ligase